MSEAVMALGGAQSQGYVRIAEVPVQGMISLRAQLSDKSVAAAVRDALGDVLGADLPKPRKILGQVAWMAPDELLIFCDYDGAVAQADALRARLGAVHHLATTLSDARVLFDLEGPRADEILAKLAPVDTAHLAADEMRRTRLAQVPAAVWRTDVGLRLMCFRSQARYVFNLLSTAAEPGGAVF